MKKKTKKKPAKPAKKKTAAKKPVKKKTAKPAKKAVKKSAVKKKIKKPVKPALPKIQGQLVGEVTHYFPHVNAAVVKIAKGEIRTGDSLYFKGHTTDFKLVISSMQIDHAVILRAGKGDEIGIQVKERVRQGDSVYKLD